MNIGKAIGSRETDYLTISNKWASVDIIRESDEWLVIGDVDSRTSFKGVTDAMAYALDSLAAYERGRAD